MYRVLAGFAKSALTRRETLVRETVKILRADFLNTAYFRRGLMCTIGLTNDLIDGGQPRAKNGF